MKYVLYDDVGEIRVWGDADSPPSGIEGFSSLAAEGSPDTHYVKNGALRAYTTGQAAGKAAAPSYPATWSNTTFSWIDSRSLSDAKEQSWETMKVARTANVAAGFIWDGSKFDSDDISQQRIQGAVQLAILAASAGQPFSLIWTLFDNSVRTLSGSEMIQVGIALGSFVQSVYNAGVSIRTQIDGATTTNDLKSITWATIS